MKIKTVFRKIKAVLVIVVVISFPFFLWQTCSYLRSDYLRLIKEGKRTVGTVTFVASQVSLEYKIGGHTYGITVKKPYSTITHGEQFEVAYDSLDPSHSDPLFFRPVINENDFASTNSIKVRSNNGDINFTYEADGKIRYHYARLSPVFSERKDIYDGKKYLVKYKKINPDVAYIYLDSLISE